LGRFRLYLRGGKTADKTGLDLQEPHIPSPRVGGGDEKGTISDPERICPNNWGFPGTDQSDTPAAETTPENPGIRDSNGGSLALPEDHRTQVENTTLLNPGGIEKGGPTGWGAALFTFQTDSISSPQCRRRCRSRPGSPPSLPRDRKRGGRFRYCQVSRR